MKWQLWIVPALGLGASLVLGASLCLQGDVTINATRTDDEPCVDCPGGKGTRLSWEVTLASGAENDGAEDFHVEVNDARADNFRCGQIERWDTSLGQWVDVGWGMSLQSQDEGKRKVHYLSFYRNFGGEVLNRGETFRFSFVYCGSKNNLDDSIEFIVTNDGSLLPAVPDGNGQRSNVPDSGSGDDPGWHGQIQKAPGSGIGFISCPTGDEMTLTMNGVPAPGQIVSWTAQLGDPSSLGPGAIAQVLASTSGTDHWKLPGGPTSICLTPDAITAMVLSFGPVFQAPIVAGVGTTPPFPWPTVPPGIRVFAAAVAIDWSLGSIPFASPTIEWLSQ